MVIIWNVLGEQYNEMYEKMTKRWLLSPEVHALQQHYLLGVCTMDLYNML